MSIISRITTWVSGQVLTAAALNGEFNNITNLFNNIDSGTTGWTTLKINSGKITGLAAATANGDAVRWPPNLAAVPLDTTLEARSYYT